MTTQEPTPEATPQAEATPVEPAGDPSGETNPQLRESRDRAVTRAENAESQLVGIHLGTMGLDPSEGLGVAVVESFKGEVTLENIAAHASDKYKYVFDPAAQGLRGAGSTPTPAEQAAAREVNIGQSVMGAAQSVQPSNEMVEAAGVVEDKINAGEVPSTQDITAGIAAKMNLIGS